MYGRMGGVEPKEPEFFNVDISFIPDELVNAELKELSQKEMTNPYIDSEERGAILVGLVGDNVQRYLDAQTNFALFEVRLLQLTDSLLNQEKYKLVDKALWYLISLGCKTPQPRRQLVNLYETTKNSDGLEKVKEDIEKQLQAPFDKSQKRQFEKLLASHF